MDLEKAKKNYKLNDSEGSVLDYIQKNLDWCLKNGIVQVAKKNFCSTTVITNLSKKMGYRGFVDLIYNLKFNSFEKPKTEHESLQEKGFQLDLENKIKLYEENQEMFERFKNHFKENPKAPIFIYGYGFSRVIAEYIQMKFISKGYVVLFSDQHENYDKNHIKSKSLISISKSGETATALIFAKKAQKNGMKIISFTGDTRNSLGEISDINFKIFDSNKSDDRNVKPNSFFSDTILIFEMLIHFIK